MSRLTEKFKPLQIQEFVGLDEPKRIFTRWTETPYSAAFLLVGDSGTGKSKMVEAIARKLNGEMSAYNYIRVPSQECTIDRVREIESRLMYAPWGAWWIIQVEEADRMSDAAQIAFLSLLDTLPINTAIFFTCNETGKLEPRFLSRCTVVKFSNYGLNGNGAAFLKRIWQAEQPKAADLDYVRILKTSRNNLRDALNVLEREGMAL